MLRVQATPGPVQVRLPPPRRLGSAGSIKRRNGRAVARTVSGPVGVGSHTLTDTVRHVDRETHHHMGTFTIPRCAGGEVPTSGTWMMPIASVEACEAMVSVETTGTQW